LYECERARKVRTMATFTLLMVLFVAAASTAAPTGATSSPDVLEFLGKTIDWYHQLALERQIATDPASMVTVNDNEQLAGEVVRLAFEFARAQVKNTPKQNTPGAAQQNTGSERSQSLMQLSTKLDNQIKQTQSDLESLRQKLATASPKQRQSILSSIAETQSELDLVNARRDAIRSMADFVSGASATGLGAAGARAQIEALAQSVPPELSGASSTSANSSAPSRTAPATIVPKTVPSGIWDLVADLIAISRNQEKLNQLIRSTDELAQAGKQLRAPLIAQIKALSSQGDTLANAPDSSDPKELAQQKKDLDSITAQFKQISTSVMPLSKQGVLLRVCKNNLSTWQGTLKSQSRAELQSLGVRLGVLALILAAVFGLGELWRRGIFRYVQDQRRRNQYLLLRKIVLWIVIALVIAFSFASQLGSVATFAGLLTAGVAVALQNVILSVAGYFFLIGKYGIRVGDRVQIAGVTGEVVDIGLVRLHLLEFGSSGAEVPTGRVVAFSNSVVFQTSTGLFRQIPGTSFVWHEISLTLSADSDYHVVESRLLGTVEAVFAGYREEMERQHRQMERTLSTVSIDELRPRSRLRLTPAGIEAAIRFPVDYQHATEIDDRVTRELLKAIDREPKLKLVGTGSPTIRLSTELNPTT